METCREILESQKDTEFGELNLLVSVSTQVKLRTSNQEDSRFCFRNAK
jgi:hypothetical protein